MFTFIDNLQCQLQAELDTTVCSLKHPFKEPTEQNTVQTYTNKVFELPIHTLTEKNTIHELSSTIANDLELIETPMDVNMYSYLFDLPGDTPEGQLNPIIQNKNIFAQELLHSWQTHFSSNVTFLEDSQAVIKSMNIIYPTTVCTVSTEKINKNWQTVKHDPKFYEHYGYLEWDMLKQFNTSSTFLQALSIAHILSPIMSFFIPLLFLIFPFIILKIQGVPISMSKYIEVLKDIAKHHFIGKAIVGMQNFSMTNLIYFFSILALYLLQMYQNTVQCLRFYRNTQKVNQELCEWKEFCDYSIQNMDTFISVNQSLITYKPFCLQLSHHRMQLNRLKQVLREVRPFKCNMSKTVEIGYMLSCYYELHENALYEESLQYAMGFDGYIHLMHGLYRNVQAGFLGYASFVSDKKTIDLNISGDETETQTQTQTQTQTEDEDEDENEDEEIEAKDDMPIEDPDNSNRPVNIIKSQYYPAHMYNLKCVKNDATLDDNIIITGPNASGKTTFLKSTALNVLFSQQVGVGFYQSCTVKPYQHMHSYLNIPDTSGRDSLFQAESRRCKEILTSIQSGGEQERHFCIFDELYSGTNPKEATKSAYAFMDYVRTFNNVDLVLTTHYTSICDRLEKSNKDPVKAVVNKQMEVLENDETGICKVKNTYKIIDGISTVEGAIRILEDMGYPEEMLETVKNIDLESEQLNTEMSIDL
tara:strand:- start:3221 stop:5323 length:2103 start_codon:yes stop_codon:yes gene_type:complete